MFPEKQLAIGPAKAGIGFLDGISRSKELPSVEKLSRESTRVNTNRKSYVIGVRRKKGNIALDDQVAANGASIRGRHCCGP
jgi:hypothetical protein